MTVLRERIPPPLRHRDFRRFFVGQSASLLGDQVSLLAVPLTAVLVLHAGAGQLGLLTAAGVLPSLLFSLPGGALVDRSGHRRRVMLVADVLRGLALISVPLGYALGRLTLGQLYVVAFSVGTLDVGFYVAYNALVVAMVPREELVSASSLLNGGRAMAQVLGLSVGGALVAALTAPGALLLDGVSFLVSGAQLSRIRPPEPVVDATEQGLVRGAGWIARSLLVRAMLASTATVNFFTFIGNTVLILYASRTLGLGPGLIGLAFGAGGLGGVLGAITCSRLSRRIGLGPAFLTGSALFPLSLLLFPLARGDHAQAFVLLLSGELLSSVGVIWLDSTAGAIFGQEIPESLRSRVSGAYRTVNYGVRPIGALLGGVLGNTIGLRDTLWVAAVGASCSPLWLLRPVILQLRECSSPQPGPSGDTSVAAVDRACPARSPAGVGKPPAGGFAGRRRRRGRRQPSPRAR